MRWPWSKREPDTAAADQALAESVRRLDEARRQMGPVEQVVAELRRARQINQFAARVAAAYREHR